MRRAIAWGSLQFKTIARNWRHAWRTSHILSSSHVSWHAHPAGTSKTLRTILAETPRYEKTGAGTIPHRFVSVVCACALADAVRIDGFPVNAHDEGLGIGHLETIHVDRADRIEDDRHQIALLGNPAFAGVQGLLRQRLRSRV